MLSLVNRYLARIILTIRYSESNKIFTHLTEVEKLQLVKLASRPLNCYVEIGSYLGASSCFIAEGVKKSGKKGKLYSVDTWRNDAMSEGNRDTFDEFLTNTKKYGDIIVPLRGNSIEISQQFDEKVDFLFIDGDHSYEGVKADVEAWFPKLNPGALVIFHDIGWAEGVQKVVYEEVKPLVIKERRLPNLYWAWLK